jgi:hypothetical protein
MYVLSPIMLRTFIVVLFMAVLAYQEARSPLEAGLESAQSHSAQEHAVAGALGNTLQLATHLVPWHPLLPAAR